MDLMDWLREGRRREREQALFYRGLSGQAEIADDAQAAERLNDLLADEQHHVSRLTARILEIGEAAPRDEVAAPASDLEGWEEAARAREADEVEWYEAALESVDDEPTLSIIREILESERNHHRTLGGKWMSAATPMAEEEEEG